MQRPTTILLLLVSLLAVPTPAQEKPGPEAVAEFKDALKQLEEAIKGRVTKDQIHFVKLIASKWEAADSASRKTALRLAKKNLKAKDTDVREATVVALGSMGGGKKQRDAKRTTKLLLKETSQKRTKKTLTFFAQCLDSIGRLKTEGGAKALIKFLRHKDNEVIAGALAGMSHYADQPHKRRWELVREIIKFYGAAYGSARNVRDTTAQRKFNAITAVAESTLQRLTKRTDLKSAPQWQKWWNKEGNKGRDW